jgi:histidine triad (HIT) family protein
MTPSRLRNKLLRGASSVLRRFARRNTPQTVRFLAWIMETFPFALPVVRLRETSTLLAFHHPAPAYPYHVLLVPKKPIATLADLDPAADGDFLTDLYATVQTLVKQFHLAEGGYRLIVNGGEYQDFPYLHFHLISDKGRKTTDL